MSAIDLASPLFAAVIGRGAQIRLQVRESVDGAAEAGKDISASAWVVRLRAYALEESTATLVDEVLTKSSTNSATGYVDHYLSAATIGTTAYDSLRWEVVLVDTANADTATKTQYRERVLARWRAGIEDAPIA